MEIKEKNYCRDRGVYIYKMAVWYVLFITLFDIEICYITVMSA